MKILSAQNVLPISESPISNGAIAVDGDKIAAVGQRSELAKSFPAAEHRDFGESVLMPGLVNIHSHLELTILRGYLDRFDDDFASWLLELTKTRANHLTDEDVRLSAILGALEGIRSGVTCFADIGRFGAAGFEAIKCCGLRGVLFQETNFSPDNRTADADFEKLREKFETLRLGETTLVKAGISPHSPYTVSRKLFNKIAGLSLHEKFPLTIHASESKNEELLMNQGKGFFAEIYKKEGVVFEPPKTSAIQYLSDISVLETRPLLAHCVAVSEDDLSLIAETGSKIAHCPVSNAKFGHGTAPLDSFLDRKIPVGLGSDSMASNNRCDLFEEARFAALAGRVRTGRRRFVTVDEIIKTVTLGGAMAIGMEDRIGTLEIGKQADIIAVSTKDISQVPIYDVYSALVFSTNARDVVFTMVAGKKLYENGEFLVMDAKDIQNRAKEISAKL